MSTTCTSPTPRVFGPLAPSLLALRGIRLWSDEHGSEGAGGDGGQGGGDQGQQGGGGNAGGQQGGQSQQGGQQGQQGQQPRGSGREASAYERSLRDEAANYRRERDQHARDLAAAAQERDDLRSWKTQREQSDAIRAGAGDKGNAALLTDSGLFRSAAEKAKLDYSDTNAVKEFVSKFVDDHPEYGQTAGLPGSGGPSRHGGPTEVTLEQQLEQAQKDGRTEDAIGLKRAIADRRRASA
jgi:hypothetical protein